MAKIGKKLKSFQKSIKNLPTSHTAYGEATGLVAFAFGPSVVMHDLTAHCARLFVVSYDDLFTA